MEQEFYARYARLEETHWWFAGRRKILAEVLARHVPATPTARRVLDVGCGTGATLLMLRRWGRVVGVDGDAQAIAFCQRRGIADARHVAGLPAAPLPFEDRTFDITTALDVAEHVHDDVALLREMRRVMKPSGRVIVTVPAFPVLWGLQDDVSHHHRRYSKRALLTALDAAGLAVLHHSFFNTLLFPPIAAVRLGRRLVPRRASDTASLGAGSSDFDLGPSSGKVNDALARLFGIEAGPVSKRGLPFGVSLVAVARPV